MGEISPAPDNLLNRDFSASAPNEKWLTDITEFQIPAGKVYLSPMIDCFDGMVVSWSIGTRPDAELVNSMLDAAIQTVTVSSDRPVVHSDRGGHYRWPGWLSRIAEAQLVPRAADAITLPTLQSHGFHDPSTRKSRRRPLSQGRDQKTMCSFSAPLTPSRSRTSCKRTRTCSGSDSRPLASALSRVIRARPHS